MRAKLHNKRYIKLGELKKVRKEKVKNETYAGIECLDSKSVYIRSKKLLLHELNYKTKMKLLLKTVLY